MNGNILGPKDPEGYYVVKLPRKLINTIVTKYGDKVQIIEIGEEILVRTKSRRIAQSIARFLK